MARDSFPFSQLYSISQLGKGEQNLVLEPNDIERQKIARAYSIEGFESLTGEFSIRPWRKAGLRVLGTVSARMERICVVTLEPFLDHVSEDFDRTFEPALSRPRRLNDLNEDGEIEIDLETLDPPDVITDGVLDLGAVLCEQLALMIDPFPRKPGVRFEQESVLPEVEKDEEEQSPFAVLASLKDSSKD